jgi:ligand-binding sensor protein
MELTDILEMEKWLKLEEETYQKSGLNVSAFNTKGVRIAGPVKNWANRICPAIKSTDKGQAFICAIAHMNMANAAQKTGKPVVGECDAGLIKIVIPVFVKDEFIGAFSACGLVSETSEIDSFLINKTTGIEEIEIEGLCSDIDTVSSEKIKQLSDSMKEKVDKVVADYEMSGQ